MEYNNKDNDPLFNVSVHTFKVTINRVKNRIADIESQIKEFGI